MNSLLQLLTSKRDAIVARWLDRTLEGYAADKTHFLKQEQDRFRNPVGHALRENLPVLLEALLLGRPAGASRSELDAIVRMRAIQDFNAAQAVSFIGLLKELVRQELRSGRQIEPDESAYAEFEARIDELALLASDLYAQCRDQIRQIKANELRRRAYVIERANRAALPRTVSASFQSDREPSGDLCFNSHELVSTRRADGLGKPSRGRDEHVKPVKEVTSNSS